MPLIISCIEQEKGVMISRQKPFQTPKPIYPIWDGYYFNISKYLHKIRHEHFQHAMDIPLDIQFVKINYSTSAHLVHHRLGWRDEWFRGRGVARSDVWVLSKNNIWSSKLPMCNRTAPLKLSSQIIRSNQIK